MNLLLSVVEPIVQKESVKVTTLLSMKTLASKQDVDRNIQRFLQN